MVGFYIIAMTFYLFVTADAVVQVCLCFCQPHVLNGSLVRILFYVLIIGSMKLICIEYNEKTTKVKEITWSAASSFGLGFHHGSFEGLQAFSAPVVQTNYSSQERYMTGERSYLCLLSSGGHLLIFGEDIVDTVSYTHLTLPTNLRV